VAFFPEGNSIAYVTYPEGILWKANGDAGRHLDFVPFVMAQIDQFIRSMKRRISWAASVA
jgi:hypothetical protein